MRLSVTVEKQLLEKAIRVSGAKTKREAIEMGLRELLRRASRERMIEHAGKVDLGLTLKELLKRRLEG
ncbi:MAG: type II toxin-antitoxin system VapB family antitoxin [candidate division NC10 bacterium]|jgi:Arc/MetJ family transcription regulator|nr:type II toxin-antitoxin system VapB family antitoxin [candidate division NC10 bacterium]